MGNVIRIIVFLGGLSYSFSLANEYIVGEGLFVSISIIAIFIFQIGLWYYICFEMTK